MKWLNNCNNPKNKVLLLPLRALLRDSIEFNCFKGGAGAPPYYDDDGRTDGPPADGRRSAVSGSPKGRTMWASPSLKARRPPSTPTPT